MRSWDQSWLEHFRCRILGIPVSHPTCGGSPLFGCSQLINEMLFRQGNFRSGLTVLFLIKGVFINTEGQKC